MDHISHPVSGQSQATHRQPHLHRRPRPSALRTQGRLSGRILRRRSSHRSPSNLRRHLCTVADRPGRNSAAPRDSRSPLAPASPVPQISPTLWRPSQPQPPFSLAKWALTPEKLATDREGHDFSRAVTPPLSNAASAAEANSRLRPQVPREPTGKSEGTTPRRRRHTPECPQHCDCGRAALQRRVTHPESVRALAPVGSWAAFRRALSITGHWPPITGHCLYERTMNFHLWKTNPSCPPHPRTKPVIVEDTTCGVSLLTGTISGSNFAIP